MGNSDKLSAFSDQQRSAGHWLLPLLLLLLAGGLRFWQLGEAPPGLYRDEAYNGLDALAVLDGEHALFFPANNGREPAYIYLTALGVALFGQTALAVRLAAAVVGTLTTWFVYQLAASWFGRLTGLFAAFMWAVTLWPVHLGRVGLRVGLLVLPLSAAAWLATLAGQASTPGRPLDSRARLLWLAAGAAYGASFYTYLASRFTPLLVGLALCLLVAQGHRRRLWPGLLWAAAGTALLLLPWLWQGVQNPDLLLGRTGQVSIFNQDINKGDFWGTLWEHCVRALGLFVFAGDDIVRHNPPGRPLFDIFSALPFAIGLVWLAGRWRRPAAWGTLLWIGTMLWVTILAEDAPHFLRAVGIFPAALFVPAVGLSWLATWPKLTRLARGGLVALLLCGILALTVRDYFYSYTSAAETAYLFEAAARELAEELNRESAGVDLVVDRRYREGWPSVPFLVEPAVWQRITWYSPGEAESDLTGPAVFYLWPHDPGASPFIPEVVVTPSFLSATTGPLARGDLEITPYALYARYESQPAASLSPGEAALTTFFDPVGSGAVALHRAEVQSVHKQPALEEETALTVNLTWSTTSTGAPADPLTVFVHVQDIDSGVLIGQDDGPPARGLIPTNWWRPEIYVTDPHTLELSEPFDGARHQILVGLYPAGRPAARWLRPDPAGNLTEAGWPVRATNP